MDEMSTSWSADHLRVSLFSSDVWSTPAEAIFAQAFGGVPEAITNKPAANEVSVVGNWDGLRLELKRAFNRLDFIVQEIPSEAAPVPLIKDIQTVLPRFSSLISKWAISQPQGVIRIALGCNALLQSEGVEESYVKLRELVKVIAIDVDRFKEFRFQVNLPISSQVSPDIKINRLSNWGSVALRAGLIGAENTRYFDNKHYVSCVLDVNTDGERTQPITGGLIEKISEELSSVCINILNAGIS